MCILKVNINQIFQIFCFLIVNLQFSVLFPYLQEMMIFDMEFHEVPHSITTLLHRICILGSNIIEAL